MMRELLIIWKEYFYLLLLHSAHLVVLDYLLYAIWLLLTSSGPTTYEWIAAGYWLEPDFSFGTMGAELDEHGGWVLSRYHGSGMLMNCPQHII